MHTRKNILIVWQGLTGAHIYSLIPLRHRHAAGSRIELLATLLSFVAKSANTQTLGDAIRSAARGDVFPTPEVLLAQNAHGPSVHVTAREHQVVAFYLGGDGHSMETVASQLGITVDMVKKHLGSVRRKYLATGVSVPTRLSLRHQLLQDGWLIEAGQPLLGSRFDEALERQPGEKIRQLRRDFIALNGELFP
ncbi:hypothetical protein PSET11_01426 [Arthrobacter ulcerisalmonis]|uniref:Uncharacterized protein n=1 Tax=Arthrobacter ulcerisalmonis TaxID=2483813 RepID=A0A3P5X079_9MICC|nr:hypothetical protein PSET11_01426 [Arthrobacter ulcerisalmonis]